jgi:pyruvate kinase
MTPESILEALSSPVRDDVRAATKIVATIGPASEDRVGELIDAGLSVARINFSHGVDDDHRRRVAKVRAAAVARRVPVGILADLQGPKLRLGRLANGPRRLELGEDVVLVEGDRASEGLVPCAIPGVIAALRTGHRVLLCDAAVELAVTSIEGPRAHARVVRPGDISDRKGVHLPDSALELEFPTDQDRAHIALARELGIDMLGLSFVSQKSEIERVRQAAPGLLLVAKIERLAALKNLRSILEACDGVMVARGDLGVEIHLEQLPLVQKSLIQEALKAGKFTITATEMLESMIEHSRPTRAEVTDVANAVLDGTDAVMLSAETAVGKYPVEAVAAMSRIARAVETSLRYRELPRVSFRHAEPTFSNATALAAAQAAEALDIHKIVCFTESGNSVRLLSRYRTAAEIVALTPNERTVNAMTILSHVRPMPFARGASLEDMLHRAQDELSARGLVLPGEEVIFVAGVPPGVSRSTNVMKLHRIGEPIRLS